METIEPISLRIKKALDIRNMRQVDLCERTGMPSAKISMYISGKRNPKQQAIYAISKALNVNPAWLMGYDVDMEGNKTKQQELAEAVRGLTEEQAVLLLAFIKTMKE